MKQKKDTGFNFLAWKLVIINTTIGFLEVPFGWLIPLFALVPEKILFAPWMLVTSMFLHLDVMHLFQNMFALAFFGILLEKIIGSKKFLQLYFVAGIAGSLASIIFYPYATSLGASGAIMGIVGALATLRPKLVVYFGGPIPMIFLAAMWIILDLAGLATGVGNVGHAAHLAGFAVGIFYGVTNYAKFQEEKEMKKQI
ncbi:rhomboid family intramembrane serine protease, partial [Candidatus Babeliales bacterium]|nr:rhomboid family intramembrane serine protease [Candidatus Babeliales bacterium]